ncbi:MAG TPA: Gfo/Idh/MocA family oxidoreductase [Blastocatellia bacterium]|nr:Gfo/Idh/MocA family oxidoreductase [Blastocatellia bacterium]
MVPESTSRREFISRAGYGAAGLTLTAAGWNKVRGANDRIRLGAIGTGGRGTDLMRWFLKEPDLEIVAICDCYEKNLNSALDLTEGKARSYRDYRALLDSKEIDAVLIATPDHWHKQMAIDACQAGKDLYIEKPLTFSIEEGHEIIQAVKASNRVLQVGLQQRSGEHYLEAKTQIIDQGKLGQITLVRTWWHGNGAHLRKPNFTQQPAGLDWKAFLGPVKYRPFNAHQFYNWRAFLDFGGGQITDLFTHWIDVVHWYLGEDLPTAVTAAGGIYAYNDGRTAPDTISIQLEYPRKWVATFDATLVPGARGEGIELMGTGGRLFIDRGGFIYQEQTPRKASPSEPVVRKNQAPLEKLHVRNFLDCVKSRQLPNSDVVSGHRSALASHLGKAAYLQKRRISFNPASEKNHLLSIRGDQTLLKPVDPSK